MDCKIEKGVPLPKDVKSTGAPRLYPFEEMEIGDSFVVKNRTVHTMRVSCSHWGKMLKRKFFAREVEKGVVRVWRVKKP